MLQQFLAPTGNALYVTIARMQASLFTRMFYIFKNIVISSYLFLFSVLSKSELSVVDTSTLL